MTMKKKTHFDLCFVLSMYVLCPLYFHYPKRKHWRGWVLFSYHLLWIHRKVRWNELDEGNREYEGKRLKTYCKCTKQNEYANFRIVHHRKEVEHLFFCPKKIICYSFFLFVGRLATNFIVLHSTMLFSEQDSFDKMFFSFTWKEINKWSNRNGCGSHFGISSILLSIYQSRLLRQHLVPQVIWIPNDLDLWIKCTLIVNSFKSLQKILF